MKVNVTKQLQQIDQDNNSCANFINNLFCNMNQHPHIDVEMLWFDGKFWNAFQHLDDPEVVCYPQYEKYLIDPNDGTIEDRSYRDCTSTPLLDFLHAILP